MTKPKCIKCGSEDIAHFKEYFVTEHMHGHCVKCGYEWADKTEDKK